MASKETVVRSASTLPTSATGNAANSNSVYVGDLDPTTIVLQVTGTYTSTMQYQTSIDGTNWVQAGADVAGTGAVSDQTNMAVAASNARSAAVWARLHCSAFTSITSVAFAVSGVPLSE